MIDVTRRPLELLPGIPAILALLFRGNGHENDFHIPLAQGDIVPLIYMLHMKQLFYLLQNFSAVRQRAEKHGRPVHPLRNRVFLKLVQQSHNQSSSYKSFEVNPIVPCAQTIKRLRRRHLMDKPWDPV